MSMLDTLLSALTGKSDSTTGAANPLGTALSTLLAQNGGIQGLMNKFSQGGLGEVSSSWVGMGDNRSISPDQISRLLGSDQVQALASNLGVDPSKASGFLADYLPKIVDKLTPAGQVDTEMDPSEGINALLPSFLASLGGGDSRQA